MEAVVNLLDELLNAVRQWSSHFQVRDLVLSFHSPRKPKSPRQSLHAAVANNPYRRIVYKEETVGSAKRQCNRLS